MSRWMYDAATQADYADELPYHHCERCGASPAHLFDHTPLAEHGTWERLCNACIDKELESWQGPGEAAYRADAEESKRSDPAVWRALDEAGPPVGDSD